MCIRDRAIAMPVCPLLSRDEVEQWRLKVLKQDLEKDKQGDTELEAFYMTDILLFIERCCQQIVTYFHLFED